MTIKIRPGQPSDKDGLISLYKAAFGKEKDPKEYEWMYEKGLFGYPIVFIAYEEETNRYAGALTTYKRKFKVLGEEEIAIGGHDHMVHPDFQRKGLYKKLLLASSDYYKENGIKFWLTFPNNKSRSAFKKFTKNKQWNYHDIGEYYRYIKPIDIKEYFPKKVQKYLPFKKILNKTYQALINRKRFDTNNIVIRKISDLDNEFDQFWNQVSNTKKIINYRDSEYIRWRYIENKKGYHLAKIIKNDEMVGYLVYKIDRKDMVIMDLVTINDEGVQSETIDSTISLCIEEQHQRLLFIMPENNPFVPLIKNRRFFDRGIWCVYGVHLFNDSQKNLTREDVWYLNFGDVEHT